MVKRTLALIVAALMLVSAAGCSGNSSSATAKSDAPKPAANKEPVTITIWMGSWWQDQAPKVVDAFAKDNKDIKLKIETLPINGYLDKAMSATLGGSPPDLLDLDATMIGSMVGKNLIQPWDDYIKDLDVKDFAPGIWSAGLYNGKVYALPNRNSSQVYFYNKTMFDDAKIPYPTDSWTYQDMLETAKKLTVPGKQYGVGIAASQSDPANVFTSFAPVVWAFGGDFLDKTNTNCMLNQPAAVKAIEFWTELYAKYKVVPEGSINYSLTKDVLPLFINNKLAMMPGTSSTFDEFKKHPELKWGAVLGPDKFGRAGGWSFTVPSTAKYQDEARKFALWFVKPENLGPLQVREPARLSAQKYAPWNSEEYKPIFQAAPYCKLLPTITEWTDVQNIIITELQKTMQGSKTPQQAADDITKQTNAILKKK